MPKASHQEMPKWAAGLVLAGVAAATWAADRVTPRGGRRSRSAAASAPAHRKSVKTHADLARPTWRDWKEIGKRVYAAMTDDRLLAVAAGVVFYGLLAFFPAITAIVSIYGLLADPATIRDHLSLAANFLPGGALDILREQVERILAKGGGQLGFGFLFGTGLALWSANAGLKAMMDALNVIYNVPEERSFIRLNAVSLALTVGAITMLLLALGAVVVFPLILSMIGLGRWAEAIASLTRWPILFVGLLLALAVLYRFGPSPHGKSWRWITPGSFFATVLWVAGSAALSYYLANFANYNATYGSLGAAIGLMMWMWMSSIVVLLGAQFNQTLDTWNDAPEKPMQDTKMQSSGGKRAAAE